MHDKYDIFLYKITNIPKFSREIEELYIDEYRELFEKILLSQEHDFMELLTFRARASIENTYTNRAFDRAEFIKIIKSIEKNFFSKHYARDKMIIENNYRNREEIITQDIFSFRKHCKYQEDQPFHECDSSKSYFKLLYENDMKFKKKKIWGIVCTKCKNTYKADYIKLYCNFCYTNYYSCIEEEDINENKAIQLQPATWEKYHCNMVINEQMKCIKCENPLSYDIKGNTLICTICGFQSEPYQVKWKCIKCGQEFQSNAKIFNQYEYKPLELAIKDALFNHISAEPKCFPCGHAPSGHVHNKRCNGEMLIAYLNERKMVMCSLCNALTKYNRYVWVCGECGGRFRGNENELIEENDSMFTKLKSKEGNPQSPIKKTRVAVASSNNKNNKNTVSRETQNNKITNILGKRSFYDDNNSLAIPDKLKKMTSFHLSNVVVSKKYSNKEVKLNSSRSYKTKINISDEDNIDIPSLDMGKYDVISQISIGKQSKIFCLKSRNESEFYALKKELISSKEYSDSLLRKYKLQYFFTDNEYITKIESFKKEKDELLILVELAVNNWNSEILTKKKMRSIYHEKELINIIYQVSSALEAIHSKGFAHCDVCPTNILVFKNFKYKLNDFGSVRAIDDASIIQRNNSTQFMSPQLNDKIKKETSPNGCDLYKSDVFALGLCVIYAVFPFNDTHLIFGDFVAKDFVIIKDKDEYIDGIIRKYIAYPVTTKVKEIVYSQWFIELLKGMLAFEENNRFSSLEVKEYIEEFYG